MDSLNLITDIAAVFLALALLVGFRFIFYRIDLVKKWLRNWLPTPLIFFATFLGCHIGAYYILSERFGTAAFYLFAIGVIGSGFLLRLIHMWWHGKSSLTNRVFEQYGIRNGTGKYIWQAWKLNSPIFINDLSISTLSKFETVQIYWHDVSKVTAGFVRFEDTGFLSLIIKGGDGKMIGCTDQNEQYEKLIEHLAKKFGPLPDEWEEKARTSSDGAIVLFDKNNRHSFST